MAAQKAETEVMDSKMRTTTSKTGVIGSSCSVEIQTLTKQISNLMPMVQGTQNKGGKSKNQRNSYNSGANTQSIVN